MGLSQRDRCEYWSYNCRLDELQAALLRVQLKNLDKQIKKRKLAKILNEELNKIVNVPFENEGEFHVYQTYVIQSEARDKLKEYLISKGRGIYSLSCSFASSASSKRFKLLS